MLDHNVVLLVGPYVAHMCTHVRNCLTSWGRRNILYFTRSTDPGTNCLSSNRSGKESPVSGIHYCATLRVKENSETIFLPIESLLWIESANKYAVLHATNRSFIVRRTIRSLLNELGPASFTRIHRTTLIRKTAVWSIRPLHHGDQTIVLKDGTALTMSRRYREAFLAEMEATCQFQSAQRARSVGATILSDQFRRSSGLDVITVGGNPGTITPKRASAASFRTDPRFYVTDTNRTEQQLSSLRRAASG
jgi:hypothetical protein